MSPRIAVCDYGVGNLRSVERALVSAGATAVVSADPEVIATSDGVVLPGVGAFAVAARTLATTGLGDAVRDAARRGVALLGVCLGHQLLFEHSDEGEGAAGLGLLGGRVVRLPNSTRCKVPHIGWNTLRITRDSRLLGGIEPGTHMYFVHAYAAAAEAADVIAVTDHGSDVIAAVERDNVMGTQFHPEKSGAAGLRVYANFAATCGVRTCS